MVETDSNQFEVNLNAFSGSLDVLLELAKSQKVNLENISVTKLADQFHEFITKTKDLNLELASEYLLTATWLTYLKSKLLLPESDEEEFKALEVAEKLKLQLKKLELIRLLSDQLLKKKRLGIDTYMRGIYGGVRTTINSNYSVTLFELLKSYSNHIMRKNFLSINIPKLPVCSADEGVRIIKNNIAKLNNWKDISELIPKKFKVEKNLRKTGFAGIFAASLELTKDGYISLMQKNPFEKLFIKGSK